MKMSEQQLEQEFKDNVQLLIDQCLQFDKGKYSYAKAIATSLRTLVHQTSRSECFLQVLGCLDSMKFLSTAGFTSKEDTERTLQLLTLVSQVYLPINSNFHDSVRIQPSVVPNFSKGNLKKKWLDYQSWYESPVFIYNKEPNGRIYDLVYLEISPGSQLIISRKKLITFFSNKLGGTHIESASINKEMYELSRGLAGLMFHDIKPLYSYKEGERHIPGKIIDNVLQMAIRQIAHEVIISIRKATGIRFNYSPSHKSYNLDNFSASNYRAEISEKNGQRIITTITR